MNSSNHYIFVYGTLVRGGRLHRNIEDGKYMGDFFLEDYTMFSIMDRYPGIIHQKGRRVLGEVFCVDYDTVRRLDNIEGEDYFRTIVSVFDITTGEKMQCKTYVYCRSVDGCKDVPENIWPLKRVKVMGYGSLMNTADFIRMFSDKEQGLIKKVGKGILSGFRLGYTYRSKGRRGGVLDVIRGTEDDCVIGVVNEMPYRLMTREIDARENNGSPAECIT